MADKKAEECPPKGAPAYMTTYGDMMTLLLTFFVLLLSFSSMQEAKFRRAIGSLQGALGVLPYEQSVVVPQEIPIPQLSNLQEAEIQESIVELQEASAEMDVSEAIKLEKSEEGIMITLTDSVLFDSGSERLKAEIMPILLAIANISKGWPNTMMISGFTDSDQIHTPQFRSNWELSSARAMEVLHYFADFAGVEENRMVPIPMGENLPIASNATEAGKAKNRRIEIFIQYDRESVDLPGKVRNYLDKVTGK